MSTSREESPDWLRSFQVPPTDSPLVLSSDSESSLKGVASGEDKTDCQESSPLKASNFPEEDVSLGKIRGKSVSESPSSKGLKRNSPKKGKEVEGQIQWKKKKIHKSKEIEGNGNDVEVAEEEAPEKHTEPRVRVQPTDSPLALSSDFESSLNGVASGEDKTVCQELSPPKGADFPGGDESLGKILGRSVSGSPSGKRLKRNSPKKGKEVEDQIPRKKKKLDKSEEIEGNCDDVEVAEEEAPNKNTEPHVSSRLPLMLSDKVHRSKALVECEGDSIDLSGDMGAVGRVIIGETTSGNREMHLDLKGTIYQTTIVPSRTFCVVSFSQTEAKIEAIMNDFIQLKPQSNVYESETMIEGTLDGFSFDSEDEADKLPKAVPQQTDQNEDAEEPTKGKTKVKADKASTVVRKRGKTAGGKSQPAKKPRKRTQVSKKRKSRK